MMSKSVHVYNVSAKKKVLVQFTSTCHLREHRVLQTNNGAQTCLSQLLKLVICLYKHVKWIIVYMH